MTVSTEVTTGVRTDPSTLLIDHDVHEYVVTKDDLLPYLDASWQRYFRTHRFNRSPYVQTAAYYAVPQNARNEWKAKDGRYGHNLESMRKHLFDEEKVSIGILDGFLHVSSMKANFELATALASAYNDWQIETWLEPEPRLRGSVHVVAQDPHAAAREIDRVAEHPQIVQVFLPTVTDRQYGDPFYWPIFEAAIRNDLVVATHHGGGGTLLGFTRYFIERHALSAPEFTYNQLTSMICNGLFDKFPELKVVMLEAGVAWVPWLMWRLDEGYRRLRAETPWLKRRPSDHMRDSVRIGTQPLGDVKPADFAKLIEMSQSERMFVFASDYPHYDADTADKVLTKALPDGVRMRIRYRNSVETYPRLANLVDG